MQFDVTTPAIPQECIESLVSIAHITSDSSIVELGCGSGGLAYALAQYSAHIEAVDMSGPMISLARAKYKDRSVTWVCLPVESFDLGKSCRRLITWLDGFHMVGDKQRLIGRCAEALEPGGVFSVISRTRGYDNISKPILEKTFNPYGISWDDWLFWECLDFPELVERAHVGLSMQDPIILAIPEKTKIEDIAKHNLNVSRTACLSPAERQIAYHDLVKQYAEIATNGEIFGYAEYRIQYCVKDPHNLNQPSSYTGSLSG